MLGVGGQPAVTHFQRFGGPALACQRLGQLGKGGRTRIFADLENVLPHNVRIVQIHPSVDAQNRIMLWIPPGFAHGFVVLSDGAEFLYKTTDYWYPEHERTLLWSDPALAIAWPVTLPTVSAKDAAGMPLAAAELYP